MFQNILLATHGTPGARKAEALAAEWARKSGAKLHVLCIINEDWKDMTGDDWLNTSTTRNKFADYVMGQINDEIDGLVKRVESDYEDLDMKFIRGSGKLEEVMAEAAKETNADVVIMGAYQKKQAPGFRARMLNKNLHPVMPCPVVVAP